MDLHRRFPLGVSDIAPIRGMSDVAARRLELDEGVPRTQAMIPVLEPRRGPRPQPRVPDFLKLYEDAPAAPQPHAPPRVRPLFLEDGGGRGRDDHPVPADSTSLESVLGEMHESLLAFQAVKGELEAARGALRAAEAASGDTLAMQECVRGLEQELDLQRSKALLVKGRLAEIRRALDLQE
jgi:hypothetical protein